MRLCIQHLISDFLEARVRNDVVPLVGVARGSGPVACRAFHLGERGEGVVTHELKSRVDELEIGFSDRMPSFGDPSRPEQLLAAETFRQNGLSWRELGPIAAARRIVGTGSSPRNASASPRAPRASRRAVTSETC